MNSLHRSLTTLQLHVLDGLLQTRSVSRTGQELGLTQSAISHTLSGLRQHFGDELLVRTGQAMEPTPFAENLREPVRSVLRQMEDVSALRETFDARRMTRGCVIAARDLTLSLFAPPLLTRFQAEASEASLRIIPWEADRLPEQLATGACDFAVGVDPPGTDGGLRIQRLFQDDYVVVCARRAAPAEPLAVGDLVQRPGLVVTRTDKASSPVDEALAAQGLKRRIVLRSAFFLAALSIVSDSDLIMVIPRRLAQKHAADFDLALLEVPLSLPAFAVYGVSHERFAKSPLHKWLRRTVSEAVMEAMESGNRPVSHRHS